MQTRHPAATWQKTASIDLQTKHHGDPGESEDAISLPKLALFPFLRRHDPDQVQGSGSPPSQHCKVLPSEWFESMGEFGLRVNGARSIPPSDTATSAQRKLLGSSTLTSIGGNCRKKPLYSLSKDIVRRSGPTEILIQARIEIKKDLAENPGKPPV